MWPNLLLEYRAKLGNHIQTGGIVKTLSLYARCGLAILVLGLAPAAGAQTNSNYSWYGEVVSFDQASKQATVRLQAKPPVSAYAGDFTSGEALILVWTPILGEADHLLYVASADVMTFVDIGYILRAKFVSADTVGNTLTVTTAMPDSAASVLQGAAGKWIKATMPKDQRASAAIATVTLSAKPDLKLPVIEEEPTAAADPAGALSNIAGTWTIGADLGGMDVTNECVIAQEGTTLSGTCASPLGSAPMTGTMAGNTAKFFLTVDFMGMELAFAFSGTLEPDGKSMNGMLSVFGMESSFTGTKK
jgi:hypothetical protein